MDEDRETLDMGRPTTGLIDVNLPNPTEEIITESPTKAETTDEMMAKFWKDMGITPPIEGDVEPNDKIIKEEVEPNEIKIEEEVETISGLSLLDHPDQPYRIMYDDGVKPSFMIKLIFFV